MTQENPNRVCKRCLLKDLDRQTRFSNVYEYIQSLPPEQKTPPAAYERRLTLCRECQSLSNGMCMECGCFVEVRAAKKMQRCPGSKKSW